MRKRIMPGVRPPRTLDTFHEEIRARFPLLRHDARGNPRVYLNSGAGSLMVDSAIEAASEAGRTLNAMAGTVSPGEVDTALFHDRVRAIVADFLNARSGREVSFHASTTAALFHLAYALRGSVSGGANIIVTDLDHLANISPWERVFGEEAAGEVRRARVGPDGRLDTDYLLSLADRQTAVLAVTMASNALGTVVPLRQIIFDLKVKAPDVVVVVDAVHHALHGPIDVQDLGCDFLAFSGYKVFGPMLGVLWGKGNLLEKIRPYRVETNKDEPPGKFEMGMLNNAALASLEAALLYLLWLADRAAGETAAAGRRQKFVLAMNAIADYEQTISRRVLAGFRNLDPGLLATFGLQDPAIVSERDPTFAFEVKGQSALETKRLLWERHGLQIADGNHYSAAVTRHLGKTALCRASFAHYDTPDTADRLQEALLQLLGKGYR